MNVCIINIVQQDIPAKVMFLKILIFYIKGVMEEHLVLVGWLLDPFRGMGARRKTMEPQGLDQRS